VGHDQPVDLALDLHYFIRIGQAALHGVADRSHEHNYMLERYHLAQLALTPTVGICQLAYLIYYGGELLPGGSPHQPRHNSPVHPALLRPWAQHGGSLASTSSTPREGRALWGCLGSAKVSS